MTNYFAYFIFYTRMCTPYCLCNRYLSPMWQDVILRLSLGARGVLNPVCATMGGIVGQEVLKACSGKFRWADRARI